MSLENFFGGILEDLNDFFRLLGELGSITLLQIWARRVLGCPISPINHTPSSYAFCSSLGPACFRSVFPFRSAPFRAYMSFRSSPVPFPFRSIPFPSSDGGGAK